MAVEQPEWKDTASERDLLAAILWNIQQINKTMQESKAKSRDEEIKGLLWELYEWCITSAAGFDMDSNLAKRVMAMLERDDNPTPRGSARWR